MTPARRLSSYAFAVGVVLVAAVLQLAIWRFIPPSPTLLFFPAVFVVGRVAGTGPGLLCTAISAYAMAYWFLPPESSLVIANPGDMLDLGVFVGMSAAISVALGQLRRSIATAELAAAEARRAKEESDAIWSMIAHDLRTPLSVITLSSDELSRKAGKDAEPSAERIRRSADRASELLQDALFAMRVAGGGLPIARGPCDVRELCTTALDAVRPLSNGHISLDLDIDSASSASVVADERRISQVLTNLLVNAIKFSPADGHVTLHARPRERGVELTVEDEGPGIPPEQLDQIFTRFWSTGRKGGTGLGLWIAKSIVEAHGSKLAVSSVVGQGTRMSFVLPCAGLPA